MPFRIVPKISSVIISAWTVVWIDCWIRSLWSVLKIRHRCCWIRKLDRRIREIICWSGSSWNWYFTTYTNSMPFRIVPKISSVIISAWTVIWIDYWIRSHWTIFKIDNRCCWIRKFDRRIREIICWTGSFRNWNLTSYTNFMPLRIVSKPSSVIISSWTVIWIDCRVRSLWTVFKINNRSCGIS